MIFLLFVFLYMLVGVALVIGFACAWVAMEGRNYFNDSFEDRVYSFLDDELFIFVIAGLMWPLALIFLLAAGTVVGLFRGVMWLIFRAGRSEVNDK